MTGQIGTAIRNQIEASIGVKQAILRDVGIHTQLASLTDSCLLSLREGGKIIFAGNGGSFADAQHLSAEFTSRFQFDRAPLPSLALGTNNSAISAIGNDYGYEMVFSRELEAIAKSGDIFIPISTSGNSRNILAAAKVAKELDVVAFGFTGSSGGMLKSHCDCICVPSVDTAHIQECHIMLGHILCGLVEARFFQRERIL